VMLFRCGVLLSVAVCNGSQLKQLEVFVAPELEWYSNYVFTDPCSVLGQGWGSSHM
jgi:hypothetical protein